MKVPRNLFNEMTTAEFLFKSWYQFTRKKRKRKDIQHFERNLEDNIFQLQHDISTLQYKHNDYEHFYVTDPKQRYISKADVRDRFVHQTVYMILTPLFDEKFIFHSLSSRLGKGTHVGVSLLHGMIRKVSSNGHKPCFALKMDIKRFFDTVNHNILKILIGKYVKNEKLLMIIDEIIDSFTSPKSAPKKVGIPLGNVTSQLFANIYLNELDDFIKQTLHERHYLRYCDDFIILSDDENHLNSLIEPIKKFLSVNLHLELHPKKLIIRKLSQGIDFVGYVLFFNYTLVRSTTKQRMKKRLKQANHEFTKGSMNSIAFDQRLQSYLGILSHANEHHLSQAIKNAYWVREKSV